MNFQEKLNNYIDIIGCTAKELADVSNISTSVLSRYRNGKRIPKYKSKQLNSLINGLITLAKNNNITNLNKEMIKEELENTLNQNNIDFDLFRNNLNLIIETLNINVSEMSKYIGFDSSYLSKIRSGVRIPQNISEITISIIKYISKYHNDPNSLELISSLIEYDLNNKENLDNLNNKLYKWITKNIIKEDNEVNNFLHKLDNFDLNDYIKTIKFNKIKIPTIPKCLPKTKTYYGLDGYKKSQIDALKNIVFSKTKQDIFFYSNMSMIEASKDLEFTKKFMIGLAFILKKGLKLNIIHNLNRPFNEIMLGIEGWIPLYMTGQINPYYFKNNSNLLYSQLECTSDTIALSGACPTGHIDKAKFYLTNKKNEINYYKDNNKILLKKANILMEIYNEQKKEKFINILKNNNNIIGKRKNIYYNLPIYTISIPLLEKILNRNNLNNQDKEIIINSVKEIQTTMNKTLINNPVLDEINILTKEEFLNSNFTLALENIFYDKKITYNYEEYIEHLNLIKEYKLKHKNYNYKKKKNNTFKNININIISNKQVIISKTNSPTIHFIIHYPKLINAIENFKAPIIEKDYTNKYGSIIFSGCK